MAHRMYLPGCTLMNWDYKSSVGVETWNQFGQNNGWTHGQRTSIAKASVYQLVRDSAHRAATPFQGGFARLSMWGTENVRPSPSITTNFLDPKV